LLLLQLLFARAAASANINSVWVAGYELHWTCWFKQQFGIPCPGCGMTRSTLLALNGHIREAMLLNPAGPLLVLGIIVFGATMLCMMLYQRKPRANSTIDIAKRRIALGSSIYGGLIGAIMTIHWANELLSLTNSFRH
jgi:hypothetical protein